MEAAEGSLRPELGLLPPGAPPPQRGAHGGGGRGGEGPAPRPSLGPPAAPHPALPGDRRGWARSQQQQQHHQPAAPSFPPSLAEAPAGPEQKRAEQLPIRVSMRRAGGGEAKRSGVALRRPPPLVVLLPLLLFEASSPSSFFFSPPSSSAAPTRVSSGQRSPPASLRQAPAPLGSLRQRSGLSGRPGTRFLRERGFGVWVCFFFFLPFRHSCPPERIPPLRRLAGLRRHRRHVTGFALRRLRQDLGREKKVPVY